MMMNDVLQKLL